MGVRLVKFKRFGSTNGESDLYDHDALYNRDLQNQHPIYAITGLVEVLNILEDSITDTNNWVKSTNTRIDNILVDIRNIQKDITNIYDIISKLNIINGVEDTYSVDMDYNTDTKILKADVKVFTDKDDTNAIQVLADGLYVPKTMTEDTETITWVARSLGETLADIYNEGIRFSHNSSSWSNLYSSSEANAWYWDDSLQSFVQPQNTSYFTGFVTKNFYDYYTHTVQLRSTDSDNDVNGVVIAFVFDENGRPHTLTALCERTGWCGVNNWALVYDFYLPDQQVLYRSGNGPNGTAPSNAGSSGWSGLSNGITVRVTKHKNIVTATCSNWNSLEINENTKITIDLNNYSWGYLFQGAVRYGYCNISQGYSFFQNIDFLSENVASSSILLASVKVSAQAGNSISVYSDGLYVPGVVISSDADNALEHRLNGYYVKAVIPSSQSDNAFKKLSDGTYYVREHSNIKAVNKSSHGFVVGDFIYYHPSNGYKKASALDDYDSNIVGMVTKVIDTNNFEYMWSGFFPTTIFNTSNGYTQGMPLYISDVTPGKVTQEQPDISKAVGYPVENAGIVISIERGIQYNMEASFGDFKISANTYNVRSDGFIRVVEDVDYKQSLVQNLIDSLEADFKAQYLILDNVNQTMKFTNVDDLYISNKVPDGLTLFIKAF